MGRRTTDCYFWGREPLSRIPCASTVAPIHTRARSPADGSTVGFTRAPSGTVIFREFVCICRSFKLTPSITELTIYDCSLCVKRNARMAKVPEQALTVLEGEDALTLYQWNTHRAKHYLDRKSVV